MEGREVLLPLLVETCGDNQREYAEGKNDKRGKS
jgi:hypothetical protein